MNKEGVIYKITNQINNKAYIGQTINYDNRKWGHINSSIKEKYKNGYNPCLGIKRSDETKQKIYNSKKGVKIHSNEFKQKIGKCHEGINNCNYDSTIYNFYHPDFGYVKCTKLFLMKIYNLSSKIYGVANGKIKSYKGLVINNNI